MLSERRFLEGLHVLSEAGRGPSRVSACVQRRGQCLEGLHKRSERRCEGRLGSITASRGSTCCQTGGWAGLQSTRGAENGKSSFKVSSLGFLALRTPRPPRGHELHSDLPALQILIPKRGSLET